MALGHDWWWTIEMISCFAALLAHDIHCNTIMYVSCLHPLSLEPPKVLMIGDGVQSVVSIPNAQSPLQYCTLIYIKLLFMCMRVFNMKQTTEIQKFQIMDTIC
jgi:hypothetical protein